MKNNYLWSVFALSIFSFSTSAQQQQHWKSLEANKIAKLQKMDRTSFPEQHAIYQLDLNKLQNSLSTAPLDSGGLESETVLYFPNAEGQTQRYAIYKAPIMAAELSEKYPNISTYSGKGIDDPSSSIRFSITPFGLHAVTHSAISGINYIDTYTKDLQNYIVYDRAALENDQALRCLVEQTPASDALQAHTTQKQQKEENLFREFRLAMACTVEYAKFHINAAQNLNIPTVTEQEKKEVVLAAMVATMTRVNYIFERDLAIRLTLVADNDKIIFVDQDEFSNDNSYQLISQSQRIITREIGVDNYDIGHTVSTGGGGLASMYVPCNANSKARGITGLPNPVGDAFDVDFVAHEMGHQFGANHTFNTSCVDQQMSQTTSYEPGSGTSIMAYAGVCQTPKMNIANSSNPYFHSASIAEINKFLQFEYCAETTVNPLAAPIADAGEDRVIPKSTAFKLTAITTAPANSALTYSWEQMDREASTQPPVSTSTQGPLFRFYGATATPTRYIPKFEDVLQNVSPKWEVLPSVARELNFNLVVRDNLSQHGGLTSVDSMKITVAEAGPFSITAPNSGVDSWKAGNSEVVSWDVAGTTENEINTSHVNILLSTDNGLTFTTLVAHTENDGSQEITVPDVNTDRARLMIEPVDNIYYAISSAFQIVNATASVEEFESQNLQLYPNPTRSSFTISFNPNGNQPIVVYIHDLSGRQLVKRTFSNSTSLKAELSLEQAQPGVYLVTIEDGAQRIVKKVIRK